MANSPAVTRSKGNGTKDSISRYSGLKLRFDSDPLNQNWQFIDTLDAKLASAKNEFNFVDLFAGAGGLSVGFKQAGFNKIFSVEIDDDASATLRKNFPESHHFEKPIEELTNGEMDQAVRGRTVHVICGGPPCQGFSVAGLRNPHDPRNQLFKEFVRVVKHLKPWMVVLENVPGILTMQDGEVYKEIVRQFGEIGYPNMNVRILEAATYGVPQLRTRAVFVGNRFGIKNPYPKEIFSKEKYKSIESAIDDLKKVPRDPSINHEWTWHSPQFEKRISKVLPGDSLYETFRDAFKRQHKGVPSMTVKENHGGCHIHYELNRVLSAREMARLQTFPDDFIFQGTMKRAYWQIGNAVPCLLAKNIGLAVKAGLVSIKKMKIAKS
jgi:DNA (cytosine-5)-methyltransferase 1